VLSCSLLFGYGHQMAASTSSSSVFTQTDNFTKGISLLNSIDASYYPPILERLLKGMKEKASSSSTSSTAPTSLFTESEQSQLSSLLSLSPTQLITFLSLLLYIFEQAAYHSLSVNKLTAELSSTALNGSLTPLFTQVWSIHRDSLLTLLSSQSFGAPAVFDDLNWRLQVSMGTKQVKTILSLGIKHSNRNGGDEKETITMELNQQQLTALYENIETIQKQLDALTEKH